MGGDESDDLMETAASEQVTTGREEGSSESQIRGHVLEELQPGRGESPASIANSGPHQVVVSGAGQTSANGTYHQDGYFQEACKYVKLGRFDGRMQKFSLYQCLVEKSHPSLVHFHFFRQQSRYELGHRFLLVPSNRRLY